MPAGHKLVIRLAAELKLPTIYPFPNMVVDGGLMCHGPDITDQSRQAGGYVASASFVVLPRALVIRVAVLLVAAAAMCGRESHCDKSISQRAIGYHHQAIEWIV
jgi:hypothetical protein